MASSTPDLVVTESAVHLLESHWSELCGEAYSISVDGGWKVRTLRQGGLFDKAGITDQSLFTPQSLLTQAKTPEQRQLVERLLAILEHIDATRPLEA